MAPVRSLAPFVREVEAQLLDDKDRFAQKAVDWTLREALAPYPEETAAFIEEPATRLSEVDFAAAANKLPAALRLHLKTIRAACRKLPFAGDRR